jgi:FRG domain
MQGQWIGSYSGGNSGKIVIDLDDCSDHYEGNALLFPDTSGIPSIVARVITSDKSKQIRIVINDLTWLYPGTTTVIPDLRAYLASNPQLILSSRVDAELSLIKAELHVNWTSDLGNRNSAILAPSKATQPSAYAPKANITSWSQFTDFCLRQPPRRYMYRGQDCINRLRTAFHRTKRKDLVQFLLRDMPSAHHALTARTRHLFDLNKPAENAAFLNLLQHHGYPTPLLDGSYSPFVAAFFAYRYTRVRKLHDDKVRIFVFDRESWIKDWRQVQTIAFAQPHFSILEALTIENLRAMPQQALSSISGVDDIEGYIALKEQEKGKKYLEVIDLPFMERRDVLDQLSLMGITAGSLFPGLDGACEELRGRNFLA